MDKKVLIIGAGVGGLATAVRLLSKGYKVEIYEKEETIGGRVNIIETENFKFDLTASILMIPNIYGEVFQEANRNYKDYLDFIRLDPFYRVNYANGESYDFWSDLPQLMNTIESISASDCGGYLEFLANSFKKYLLADKYFLQKSFNNFNDFFNLNTLAKAMEIKTFSNTYNFISKYVEDEKLRKFILFQAMYAGISPFDGPNIYTLIPAVSEIFGLWHLKGGMYSYINSLGGLINELGGNINIDTNVEEIVIQDGNVKGIITSYGFEKGDIVVCNADFPYAMNNLIKDNYAKGQYKDEKISEMKYSCSIFILYLGLNKKYDKLLVHNLYLGDDFKANIGAPFKGKLPEQPSLYIYCPSNIDESMADEGKECLNIMVRVPNLLFDNIEWNSKTINSLKKIIFNTLQKINGLEDIEEHIIYESYLTPKDLLNSFNSYGGTAFGLSHTLTQTNYFRPGIKSSKVENLYFVGSSVHPGTGVSIVLLSSKMVAEEIHRNENKKQFN